MAADDIVAIHETQNINSLQAFTCVASLSTNAEAERKTRRWLIQLGCAVDNTRKLPLLCAIYRKFIWSHFMEIKRSSNILLHVIQMLYIFILTPTVPGGLRREHGNNSAIHHHVGWFAWIIPPTLMGHRMAIVGDRMPCFVSLHVWTGGSPPEYHSWQIILFFFFDWLPLTMPRGCVILQWNGVSFHIRVWICS